MHINNLCTAQLGICRITLIHNGVEFQYGFFIVPRNGPTLVGMQDCERMALLS